MTVAELKEELKYYEDDMEVEFEFDSDVEVDSWTENKYGMKEVKIYKMLKPSFISEIRGNMRIQLEVADETKS